MDPSLQQIRPEEFWRALAGRACGVAVVTSAQDGVPSGFLALSVTHLTADPPTITVSIGATTSALATIKQSGVLAVNYLRAADTALYEIFSGKMGVRGAERFAADAWVTMATGAPILNSCLSALDCVVDEMIERHEVVLVIARIVQYRDSGDAAPMIHFRGKLA